MRDGRKDQLFEETLTCPTCGTKQHTFPAEGVPNQSLRIGADCGDDFFLEETKEEQFRLGNS